jgi:hypothetical protein
MERKTRRNRASLAGWSGLALMACCDAASLVQQTTSVTSHRASWSSRLRGLVEHVLGKPMARKDEGY